MVPESLFLPTMLYYLPLWILLCAPKTEGRVGLTVTFYPVGLLWCPQGLREEWLSWKKTHLWDFFFHSSHRTLYFGHFWSLNTCGFLFPHSKQFCNAVSVPYHLTQFWHYLPGDDIRSTGLGLSPTRLPSISDANPKSGLSPGLTGYKLELWPSFWFQLICWSGSRSSGKQLIYIYRFLIKGYDRRWTPRRKRCIEQGRGKGHGASTPPLGYHTPSTSCVHQSESSLNPVLLGFNGGFVT